MLKPTKIIGGVVLILAVVVCTLAVYRSSGFEQCVATKNQQASKQKQDERSSPLMIHVDCIGVFAHENHGPITGAFTIVLAFSTILLWVSTRETALVAKAALTEIERAFVSGRYSIEVRTNPQEVRWEIVTFWKNAGSTPARKVFSHASWDHFPTELPPDFNFPDIPTEENTMSFIAPHDETQEDPIRIPTEILNANRMGWLKIYFWGWVEYDDVFKGSRPHRTEFCHEIISTGDPYATPTQSNFPIRMKIYPKHTGADQGCYREAREASSRHLPLG